MSITCPACSKVFARGESMGGHMRHCTVTHEQLFWLKVTKSDGCWLYKGDTLNTGHGRVMVNRQKILAHRYSWTLANGPIPHGMYVLHRCNVPLCVNPGHLYIGTQVENHRDRVAAGRAPRINGSKFAPASAERKL